MKQKTVDGPDEILNAKPKRTILPRHERIERDAKRLQEQRDKLREELEGEEVGILSDIQDLLQRIVLAKDEGLTPTVKRLQQAAAALVAATLDDEQMSANREAHRPQ